MTQNTHLLIIEGRFYERISDALLAGAKARLKAAGATCEIITVPGALEIPLALGLIWEQGKYDGVIALGCVIRGETGHYEVVVENANRSLMDFAVSRGVALGNGILTVESEEQAWDRARPDRGDKGGGAVDAALGLIALRRRFTP